MKLAPCVAAPPMHFPARATDKNLETVNAVPIYRAPQSKEKILASHYNTKQEDAALRKQKWTETVQCDKDVK